MSTPSIFRQTKALSEFYKTNPLDFKLLDEEGKQALYILSADLDVDSPGKTHHLFIANKAEEAVQIVAPANVLPGSNNYHFELRFRPGVLSENHFKWVSIGNRDWRSKAKMWTGQEAENANIEEGSISIYLLYIITADTLAIEPADTILLPLDNIKAYLAGGSRGTGVELRYNLAPNSQIIATPPADAELKYLQEHLEIINYFGIKDITFDATFHGSSTILNDGDTANNLSLQLTNMDRVEHIPLCARNSENPTKFILYFDTSEKPEAWALCDHDNALAIDVSLQMPRGKEVYWHIQQENQGFTARWILTVEDDIIIDPSEHFFLHLKGIISAMPSGFTNLHLSYENVPGFWDGKFVVAIEKSPIKIQDTLSSLGTIVGSRVGIGTTNPQAALDVNGDVKARKLILDKNLGVEAVDSESITFSDTLTGQVISGGTTQETIKITASDGKVKASSLQVDDYTFDKSGSDLLLSGGQLTVQGKVHSGSSMSTDGAIKTGDFSIQQTTDDSGRKFLQVKDDTASLELSGFVPKGSIVMWIKNTIPNGWTLCDGTKGAPDLRSRFIVGYDSRKAITPLNAGDKQINYGAIDNTGGKHEHTLSMEEMPNHNHGVEMGSNGGHSHELIRESTGTQMRIRHKSGTNRHTLETADDTYGSGVNLKTSYVSSHKHTISQDDMGDGISHENRPPYYVLAFIMKL